MSGLRFDGQQYVCPRGCFGARPFRCDHIARAPRGSHVRLGDDIGLEAIPFRTMLGSDLRPVTHTQVMDALKVVVGEEIAARRAARRVGRDGLRGDGRHFNARTFQWELI